MEKIEKINLTIALDILYVRNNKQDPPYVSRYKSKHETERWHYLAVKLDLHY